MSSFLENVVNRAKKKQTQAVAPALTPERLQDIYFASQNSLDVPPRTHASESTEKDTGEARIFKAALPENLARSQNKTDYTLKTDGKKTKSISIPAGNNPNILTAEAEVAQPSKELQDQTSIAQEKSLESASASRIISTASVTANEYASKQNGPAEKYESQLSTAQKENLEPQTNSQVTRQAASIFEFKAENYKQESPVHLKPHSRATDAAVIEAEKSPRDSPQKKPAHGIRISPKIASKGSSNERSSKVVVTIKKIMTSSEDNYPQIDGEEKLQSTSSTKRVVTFTQSPEGSIERTPEVRLKPEPEAFVVPAKQSGKPVEAKSAAEQLRLQPTFPAREKMARPQTSSESTVTIRIGRIEVHAVQAQEQSVAEPRSPALSLNDYLKQHSEVS